MSVRIVTICSLLMSLSLNGVADDLAKKPRFCRSAREYVTTLEFLRTNQEKFGLEEQRAQKIAMNVAGGCTGAAKQFINVLNVLSRAEIGTREAMQLSLDLSSQPGLHAEVFLAVFKRAYLKKYLDLDLATSVKIAKLLTLEFKGNVKNAGRDFEEIVEFCLDEKKLGLPIVQCAETSAVVASKGEYWKDGVASAFIRAYEFLRSGKGVGMSVGEALLTAAGVVENGPYSVENFVVAYKYGASEQGLAMTAQDSLDFARGLVAKTIHLPGDSKIGRMPTSQE